ncbi:hypothetical protein D9M72_585120 [compost metagenome]
MSSELWPAAQRLLCREWALGDALESSLGRLARLDLRGTAAGDRHAASPCVVASQPGRGSDTILAGRDQCRVASQAREGEQGAARIHLHPLLTHAGERRSHSAGESTRLHGQPECADAGSGRQPCQPGDRTRRRHSAAGHHQASAHASRPSGRRVPSEPGQH